MYTTSKPEEATFKYSNLGGYEESYDSTKATQLHQVPITIGNDGAIMATAGSNYKKITETQFTARSTGGPNADFANTTKGAAALSAKFNNGEELQFKIPLRRICRVANCQQMFPAGKKIFITLYKAHKSFLMTW